MAPAGEAPLRSGASLFLVERYWPAVSLDALSAAVADMRKASGSAGAAEGRVRHIRTTLVVLDETVFSVFEADSLEGVPEAWLTARRDGATSGDAGDDLHAANAVPSPGMSPAADQRGRVP